MGCAKLLLLTIALMISACNPAATETLPTGASTSSPNTENRLAGMQWMLKSFGPVGTGSPIIEGTPITLTFGADGRAGGSGGCNSYGGAYQVRGNRLSLSQIISTKRACLEEALTQQEQRYFQALESAGKFTLADDHLTIFYDDGRSALNFVKTSSAR